MNTQAIVRGVIFGGSFVLAACSAPERASTPVATTPSVDATAPADGDGLSIPGIVVPPAPQPLFAGVATRATRVAPVVGGTLSLTRDGTTIVAVDPDRDTVFLVDPKSKAVRSVALQRGDEPGRVAEGAPGTLYVALRRAGALATVDVASGAVLARTSVCVSPRGVAYDSARAQLVVACRSGLLVTLAAADLSVSRRVQLDADLRDVIVRPSDVVVTRFLSSEVMVVSDDGSVSRRAAPNPEPGCGEASVAFRALALSSGQIAVAHQASSVQTVDGSSGGYGFSCGGSLVNRFLSLVDVDHAEQPVAASAGAPTDPVDQGALSPMTFVSDSLPGAGPLDIAFDEKGSRIAAIAVDNSLAGVNGVLTDAPGFPPPSSNLWVAAWNGKELPMFTSQGADGVMPSGFTIAGQPVAVAFDASGQYVVQSREPATLSFEDGTTLSLSSESHADTGQAMFYMNSGIGISCSSCHPEGGEDGHVWHFSEGLRRTMPLEGGVLERAPFHWDGTLGDMNALVSEVMLNRMALAAKPSDAQIGTLGSFLEQLPNLPAADGLDSAAVQRGRALFQRADVACASCHGGAQYTNNLLEDVGTGGSFSTPSLLGVGLRTALFHDGCAKNVSERFGPCGGTAHGKPELLSDAERADLIVFLRSL